MSPIPKPGDYAYFTIQQHSTNQHSWDIQYQSKTGSGTVISTAAGLSTGDPHTTKAKDAAAGLETTCEKAGQFMVPNFERFSTDVAGTYGRPSHYTSTGYVCPSPPGHLAHQITISKYSAGTGGWKFKVGEGNNTASKNCNSY
jgi:hypothetical protein